jgi:hypothetical protein
VHPLPKASGEHAPTPPERRGLIHPISQEHLGHFAVANERACALAHRLFEHFGGAIELGRRLRIEAGAQLLRDPLCHLFEGLIHASEVHVERGLCHSSELRDPPSRQGAVSVALDRFENRLKQTMPRTFLVDLA